MSKKHHHHDEEAQKNKWESMIPEEEREEDHFPSETPGGEEKETAETYEELKLLYEATKQKEKEYWEQVLRSEAEFRNLQARMEKRITETHKFAGEKIILELLPVMDSLEQGLEHAPQEGEGAIQALREGMKLTLKMFQDVLAKFGVSILNPLNESYDSQWHEALSMQEIPGVSSGTVTAVIQKGYVLHGRVIRPARVMVAK